MEDSTVCTCLPSLNIITEKLHWNDYYSIQLNRIKRSFQIPRDQNSTKLRFVVNSKWKWFDATTDPLLRTFEMAFPLKKNGCRGNPLFNFWIISISPISTMPQLTWRFIFMKIHNIIPFTWTYIAYFKSVDGGFALYYALPGFLYTYVHIIRKEK